MSLQRLGCPPLDGSEVQGLPARVGGAALEVPVLVICTMPTFWSGSVSAGMAPLGTAPTSRMSGAIEDCPPNLFSGQVVSPDPQVPVPPTPLTPFSVRARVPVDAVFELLVMLAVNPAKVPEIPRPKASAPPALASHTNGK